MLSKLFKKAEETTELVAYVSGKSVPLSEVPDEVFSTGCLGNGMAIEPSSQEVVAPTNGEISMVAETKHACGIQLNDGVQLLIHIGLDTVSMNGQGFTVHVQEGQKVKKGQQLITFDRELIKQAGYKDIVVLVAVENEKNLSLEFRPYKEVTANEDVIVTLK